MWCCVIYKVQECDDARFPTCAAYNSLVVKPTQEVTNISVLHLIPGSPTDWSNLYTALKICQGINVETNQQQKNYNLKYKVKQNISIISWKCMKYFFTHDQINYARLAPLYVADMYNLWSDGPGIWAYLESGHFTVNKNHDGCSFTSIGMDHALEQEYRAVKVQGGIKGLTNVNKYVSS